MQRASSMSRRASMKVGYLPQKGNVKRPEKHFNTKQQSFLLQNTCIIKQLTALRIATSIFLSYTINNNLNNSVREKKTFISFVLASTNICFIL